MCIRDRVGIVDLGADDGDSCAERADLIGLALLELSQSLTQVRQDQALRAGVGNEVDDMEQMCIRDRLLIVLLEGHGGGRQEQTAQLAALFEERGDMTCLLYTSRCV